MTDQRAPPLAPAAGGAAPVAPRKAALGVIRKVAVRALWPVVILLLGAGGAFALLQSKPTPPLIESTEKAWIVAVETVEPTTFVPTLTLYGRASSPHVARISAAVNADVQEVEVLEGRKVRAGQLLVRLDDREARLLLGQRRAEVADIEAQLASEANRFAADGDALGHERRLLELQSEEVRRMRELAQTQVGSRSQLDSARQEQERYALDVSQRELAVREHDARRARLQAQLDRAAALSDRAALDLSRTEVKAPFDGRIASLEVSPGDRVRPGDRLLSVYDTGSIEIRSQIPSRYLPLVRGSIQAGARLRATAMVDGREIVAELDRLTGEVARRTGGTDALLQVIDGGDWLRLGRTVALTLELPPEDGVVAVPYEAIYGTDRLFVLEGERMRGIVVERVGEIRLDHGEGRALLRSDELRPGTRVVVTQLPNAVDGLKVKVGRAGAKPTSSGPGPTSGMR